MTDTPSNAQRGATSREPFWAGYWRSLKPLEVEEPIDVWVHRPPAYVLARLLLPTPVSPNLITVCSIVLGVTAGVCIVLPFQHHLPWAGGLVFASAVFDCADGQLARLRRSSSPFGRMLDGIADLTVSTVVVAGSAYLILRKFWQPHWLLGIVALLTLLTIVTSSFHTTMYDQYKNVFLRLTHPSYRDGEDFDTAERRYLAESQKRTPFMRFAWAIYFFFLRSQRDYVQKFDPYCDTRFSEYPPFNEQHATLYRLYAGSLMRVWRTWFGFGSMVFGLALSIAFDVTEYYLLIRLVLLNAVFYGYLRPRQRIASERTFREIASPA